MAHSTSRRPPCRKIRIGTVTIFSGYLIAWTDLPGYPSPVRSFRHDHAGGPGRLSGKLLSGREPDGGTGPRVSPRAVVPGPPIGRGVTSSARERAEARVVVASIRAGSAGAVVCENQSGSLGQEGCYRSFPRGRPGVVASLRTAGVIPVRDVVEMRSVSHRQTVTGDGRASRAGCIASVAARPPRSAGAPVSPGGHRPGTGVGSRSAPPSTTLAQRWERGLPDLG
jgi:hypothetical protein